MITKNPERLDLGKIHDDKVFFHEMSEANLKIIQEQINKKEKSIREIAKTFNMHHSTFSEKMAKSGFPLEPQKAGRKEKKISEETKQLIIDSHTKYNLGLTKTHQKLIYDFEKDEDLIEYEGEVPSYHVCRKVFNEENLYKYEKSALKPIGLTRYVACYSNLIWHVDIHFMKHDKENPMYSIIDDYSRKILGAEILRNCKAKTCRNILHKTIEKYGVPFCDRCIKTITYRSEEKKK